MKSLSQDDDTPGKGEGAVADSTTEGDQKMLPHFGIINMSGRCYDPVLGRMLSVDNYVQDATSTQAYNRYSYVLNNPLKYTDPSGGFIF